MSNHCHVTQGPSGSDPVSKKVAAILNNNPLLSSVRVLGSAGFDVLKSSYLHISKCTTLSRIVSDGVQNEQGSLHITATPSSQVCHDSDLEIVDSFTLTNNNVRLILTPNTFQQSPSLAKLDSACVKKLHHTKKGHGAKHFASFNHSITLLLKNTVPAELVHILDTVFGESDVKLVSYNIPPMEGASIPQLVSSPINPRLDSRALFNAVTLGHDDLHQYYEYLTLLHMNSSTLIPDHIDTYLSSYTAPEPATVEALPVSRLYVQNVHSQTLASLDSYFSVSIRTSNAHYMIHNWNGIVTVWECQ